MDTEPIRLEGGVSSHLGYRRQNNEDNFLLQGRINEDSAPVLETAPALEPLAGTWHCFAVFDGIGGGERGEVASWLAASEFRKLSVSPEAGQTEIRNAVLRAFRSADRRIVQRQDREMYGATAVAAVTDGRVFRVFHLGDSRAYLFRFGALFPLTADHTLAQMKIEIGYYGADDPRALRERRQLTEYIGCAKDAEELCPEESEWLRFIPGDRLLLCSSGLTGMCSDRDLRETLSSAPSPIEAAWRLTERALMAGGQDNVTALVVGRL